MTIDEARVIDAKAFMLSVYSMGLLTKDMEQANINQFMTEEGIIDVKRVLSGDHVCKV